MKAMIDWGYSRWRSRHEWSAELYSSEGEYNTTLVTDDLSKLLVSLRRDYGVVKPSYTLAGWNRNVTEFEHSRRGR